jgi:hypothetical protein
MSYESILKSNLVSLVKACDKYKVDLNKILNEVLETSDKKGKLVELIYNYAFNRFQMGTIDTMDHDDSLYQKYERRMLLTEKELFDYIKEL